MRIQLRLLLETFALTALIWTYADQASYDTHAGVVAVSVFSAQPDVVAAIEGARPGSADTIHIPVKVRGPKAAIRKLELDKGTSPVLFSVRVPISDDAQMEKPQTRDILDEVARLPAIRDRGLQLAELSRHNITFTLQRYLRVNLTVDTDAGKFAEALVGKPTIRPAQVTARVLESELKKRDSYEPRLVIPIEERVRARSEESEATFDVPLGTKWLGMDATFDPPQVSVSVRLARRYETVHVTLIPLRVLMPPGLVSGDYEIQWETDADLVQDVDVRVPIGKPRALANTDVTAFVQIEKSDLPEEPTSAVGVTTTAPAATGGWSQREIHFTFAPGFEDVRVDGPPRKVKFRIARRPSGSGLPASSELP